MKQNKVRPFLRSVFVFPAIFFMILAGTGIFIFYPSSSSQKNILLITVDTLRADHLPSYGYSRQTSPEIDNFFSSGTIFRRAYATASFTSPSLMSILTGMNPNKHGVRLLFQNA